MTDADGREVLEYSGSTGQVISWYALGLGSNEVLARMDVAANQRTTYLPDMQGSTLVLLGPAGTLAKTPYLPFGQSADTIATYRYTGQRLDNETAGTATQPGGLYYYRARTYSPALGRFLQPDPIGYAGGRNLYAYVGNDPVNLMDPSGLAPGGLGNNGGRSDGYDQFTGVQIAAAGIGHNGGPPLDQESLTGSALDSAVRRLPVLGSIYSLLSSNPTGSRAENVFGVLSSIEASAVDTTSSGAGQRNINVSGRDINHDFNSLAKACGCTAVNRPGGIQTFTLPDTQTTVVKRPVSNTGPPTIDFNPSGSTGPKIRYGE